MAQVAMRQRETSERRWEGLLRSMKMNQELDEQDICSSLRRIQVKLQANPEGAEDFRNAGRPSIFGILNGSLGGSWGESSSSLLQKEGSLWTPRLVRKCKVQSVSMECPVNGQGTVNEAGEHVVRTVDYCQV
jgi:hypothetical protein